jgi:tetratricopeptide (TPR) repeat protein
MALSEIEKLERRYAENPQGLTFAPLAEVHRKNGEVQRALDLLGPGLQIHPDYIPASIVLGRCHMDLGDVHAAETAFLHVLALDGENVIALKALADISERLLKFDDAERWLNNLLTVDRSNDDAREQLQRVEISRRQAEVASSAEPSSVIEAQAEPETAQAAEAAPSLAIMDIALPPPRFEPPIAEPAVGWVSQSGRAGDTPPLGLEDLEPSPLRDQIEEPAGIQLEEAVGLEDSVEPLDGLVGREVDTPDEEVGEFRVETSEDIILQSAGGSEFQMPDASQELFAADAHGERAPFEEDAPVAPSAAWEAPPAERTPEPEVAESEESAEERYEPTRMEAFSAPESPAAETVAPAPVAPEPIAFSASVPSDFHYHRRDEDREEAQPPAAQPPAAQPPAAQPKRSYGVGETGGRSVAQLFKGILSARPPAQASAAPVRQAPAAGSAGAPTRPAADALSLSSVFGEASSETPPAVPASNAGAGSVSFDDFFGSSSASPAARTPRAPDPKNDDLDQFHTWLQNLKR